MAATGLLLTAAAAAGAAEGIAHELALDVVILIAGLAIARHVVLLVLAVHKRRAPAAPAAWPRVCVVMPAYNEEAVVDVALTSLLAIDYPDLEIIFVDDGSTDATLVRARAVRARHPAARLRIFTQTNSGKASALNTGIRHSNGEFILCVDADSRVQPDAIRRGLPHFTDPAVAAVGGVVEVDNRRRLLARFQQLEYTVGFNLLRRALSYFGAVIIVPGPIGLFRREAVVAVGGYNESRDLFAEDADLTVRMLSHGWRVVGEPAMVAHTEVPEDIFSLLRQRYRWKRGLYQTFDINVIPLLLTPDRRGMLIALVLGLEYLVLDVVNAALLLFFLSYALFYGEIQPMLWFYLLLVGLDTATVLVAHRGASAIAAAVGLSLLQRFSYAQLLLVWGILTLVDEWCLASMDWDKLERLTPGPATRA